MKNADPGGVLSGSVLVLNRFYMAVHVVNVRRAFILLYRQTAEVIHLEDGQFANYDFETWCEISTLRVVEKQRHEDWVRAVNFQIQVPRVIRLVGFERAPRQSLRFNRRNLFARDQNRCQYCGQRLSSHQLTLDHVVPRSRGGKTSWDNVVCSCVGCNTKKGGRTPQEARMRLMREPTKPRHNPLMMLKLGNPKYESWRTFLPQSSAADVG